MTQVITTSLWLVSAFCCCVVATAGEEPSLSRRLQKYEYGVNSIKFSRDGTRIVVGTDDTLAVWRVSGGQLIEKREFVIGDLGVYEAQLYKKGKSVIYVLHGKVMTYDLNSSRKSRVLFETGMVNSDRQFIMDVSPDGMLVAVAGSDASSESKFAQGTLTIHDLRTRKSRKHAFGSRFLPNAVRFAPNGKSLAIAGDQHVRLLSLVTFKKTKDIDMSADIIDAIAFSPDGTKILARCSGRSYELWDIRQGKRLRKFAQDLKKGETRITSRACAFSPDGKLIALSPCEGRIELRETSTGNLVSAVSTKELINVLTFSPKGDILASGGDVSTGELHLWDVKQILRRGVKSK